MPYKDPAKKKEKDRRWRLNNPEKAREGSRRRATRYYVKHKEEINEHRRSRRKDSIVRQQLVDYNRNRRRTIKQQVLDLFGGVCARCGFSDPRALQIDHVNGGGKKSRRDMKTYTAMYKAILADSTPYQLLCANCNWIKRAENKELGKAAQYEN